MQHHLLLIYGKMVRYLIYENNRPIISHNFVKTTHMIKVTIIVGIWCYVFFSKKIAHKSSNFYHLKTDNFSVYLKNGFNSI